MPASILILRHGQSTWNADGRWQGRQDPPLSTLGVRQARAAAAVLGAFDIVAASSLDRARTTAEILANELGIGPVETDPDLSERCAGAFEGLTKEQIEEQYPGWLADGRRPEGWEADESLTSRAAGALGRIAGAVGNDGTAVVVSHSGVVYALEDLLGVTGEGRLPNLGGRWFHVGPGEFRAGDRVTLLDGDLVTIPGHL